MFRRGDGSHTVEPGQRPQPTPAPVPPPSSTTRRSLSQDNRGHFINKTGARCQIEVDNFIKYWAGRKVKIFSVFLFCHRQLD